MGSSYRRYLHKTTRGGVLAVIALLALLTAGCNDTCVTFVSNPPQGQMEVHHPCKGEPGSGTFTIRLQGAACATCSDSGIEHLYVGVEGVDLQPSGDQVTQWESVASRMGPVQMDLLAQPAKNCAAPSIEGVARAGTYSAIRLRLLSKWSDAPAAQLTTNACGGAVPHCLVLRDGRRVPLALEEVLEVPVTSEDTEPGLLFVFPDAEAEATLSFSPLRTPWIPDGQEGMRIWPALRAVRGDACASPDSARP